MINKWCLYLGLFCFFGVQAQEIKTLYITKQISKTKDTIYLEKESINSAFFKLLDKNQKEVDSSSYFVDFKKGQLFFKDSDSLKEILTVKYLKYPEFLTKTYRIYEENQVVSNNTRGKLYAVSKNPFNNYIPFNGLTTSGSLTRGVSVGNNQNAVVNSNLDLQITGKISDKVSLRASLQDSNIPIQNGGYSQKIDEFDQIFIELFTDNWKIRAGDLFLENRTSKYLNFNKKVQGLSSQVELSTSDSKTIITASAALVRGQYAKSNFVGQEGNQGPYKLKGNNGELYVLVISGSERVFINGIAQQRGENKQYTIDYNAGEITFTSLFPITSEMRITVEYQYAERSFTRFITYAGASHERENWTIGAYIYSENDVKNQPLQQSLTSEQVQILSNAGDNLSLMNAPSAFEDSFSDNKILYKKVFVNSIEVFEFSNNPTDVLFNVKFSFVGNNAGNYIVTNSQTIGRIYQYVAPINGVLQGNFEPIVRLISPTKIQIATVNGSYNFKDKTKLDFEIAVSNKDQNLFSTINDNDNKGFAGNLSINQRLYSKEFAIDASGSYQIIQKNFNTIERLFNIEFNRDWNITNAFGNQSLLTSGVNFNFNKNGFVKYDFERLAFSDSFLGSKHSLKSVIVFKNISINNSGSIMQNDATLTNSKFIRNNLNTKYNFSKNWIGLTNRLENHQETIKATNQLSNLTQKFNEFGGFLGRGDSTKVFIEIGYLQRVNDSLKNGFLSKVNKSSSYYLRSKLIQTNKSDLSVFVNFRTLKYFDSNLKNEPSLNSRILYNSSFLDNLIQLNTALESNSGTVAQQEFTYLEVEPTQGVYMWNDYNGNGIQELQEFEVAPFPDQAKYVRVFLPNQVFIRTHQNKFSNAITLNPLKWQNEQGFKKTLSYFYNQTAVLISKKIKRNQDAFEFNLFNNQDLIGLNSSVRNSTFYNRGKQNHSITYTFLNNKTKNLLSIGSQENNIKSNIVEYNHLLKKSWLFSLTTKKSASESISENFAIKNFEINSYQFASKISYLFSQNTNLDLFFEHQNKQNNIGNLEELKQNKFGTSFNYSSLKQFTINGEFSFYVNNFSGNATSGVAFNMLEGLQPNKNQTWRLLVQKNITKYLDVNVNYQGRKSQTSKSIHSGNIQLRAYF